MEKIWLAHYPPGIPEHIDHTQYDSLLHWFDETVERYRDRVAFTNFGSQMTYGELDAASRAMAVFLQKTLALSDGERVALMMPNCLQYPVCLFGVLRAGCIAVNVNPQYTVRELTHQLKDAEANTIVILENFAHVLENAQELYAVKNVVVTRIGDLLGFPKSMVFNFASRFKGKGIPKWDIPGAHDLREALKTGGRGEYTPPTVDRDDIAFLQYTGGTTGVAKGAMLTHSNLIANMLQASAWIAPCLSEERSEVIITALPLYHIFSLLANCFTFMNNGGMNVLVSDPRDFDRFIKLLHKTPLTALTGVNTLFNALLNHPKFASTDFSTLRMTLGGGMAVQEDVARRWHEVTGTALVEAYGLTETSPAVCINPMTVDKYTGCIGMPVPSTEISVRDEEGNEVALGHDGELCVRGPQVMKGYWQRHEETSKTFCADGWLKTGDIVNMDSQGYLRIVDRKKDLIIVSGFNVYPNEIENVLASHPGVLEVGVVGVPVDVSGEVVKAIVVKDDHDLTEQDLIDYCRKNLTGYKVPKVIEFRDDLPKSNVGKILRRELR